MMIVGVVVEGGVGADMVACVCDRERRKMYGSRVVEE